MGSFKIILFVACFAASQCVFADDCSQGEFLWCSSFKQAQKCSAFSHCKNTVWKNEMPTEDPSEVCLFCETIVKDVVNMLSQNKSMDVIQDFLITACSLIPSTKASAECKMLIKEGLPYIVELIQEHVDPKVICGLLGLCKNQFYSHEKTSDDHHFVEKNEDKKEELCDDCINFVNKTKDTLLSNETEKKVLNFMENTVCNFFLIGKAKCKEVSEKFVTHFFNSLRKDFDPLKICAIFCEKGGKRLTVDQKFPDTTCMGCRFIAEKLLRKLADPKFQKSVVDFLLEHICPMFGNASKECSILVKSYGASTLEMIVKYVDAKQVCHVLGICDALVEIKSEDLKMRADKCETCQIIAQYLEALLETEAVVIQIEKFLSKGCSLFPESFHTTCQDLVEEYGNLIIHYVSHIFSPQDICHFLNLCQEVSTEGQHHKCISGPEFWCASPKNAELCVAEDYCKKFFWI